MPPLVDVLLATLPVFLAAFALLDRHLVRACSLFVLFALVVALNWWQLGFIWLALLETLLGAALTGAFLFHALGIGPARRAPPVRRSHGQDPLPLTWRRGLVHLMPVLALLGMLAAALASLPASDTSPAARWSGLVLVGLGLWVFNLKAHLLRRLLAFNITGTGIFLLLMTLVGEAGTAAGQALVITGLVVAWLGTVLGALLIRRLGALATHHESTLINDGQAS
ncbi:NADH-quinone oxidoreductase subunit K [Halomonas sp. DQ26W]|uniref:NADH-quinone oxidoreductase subunit K n=1 Tax=Halomonas sp. DQ26W TaxID=2282311 RepID=UPI000DF83401|nr:NADH-quinone oxidoreductase subunit K [Halomonas sp. DQ26W]RDB42857.1 NADH-quinone oxidoreductase subunit K [Halomonas sp. DQ26W]